MTVYLVTGGAGFIGSAIVKRLISNGHKVYIIDNLKTGYLENVPNEAVFIDGDFSKDEIIAKLNDVKFDAIFHIGGQSSSEISFEKPENDQFYTLFEYGMTILDLIFNESPNSTKFMKSF